MRMCKHVMVFAAILRLTCAYYKTKNYGVDNVAAVLVMDNETHIGIVCQVPFLEVSEKVPPLPKHMKPTYLELQGCITNLSYASLLTPLNIEARNTVSILTTSVLPLSARNFKGLMIQTLKLNLLKGASGQKLAPHPNFLKPLTTLRELVVTYTVLPPLPMTTKLQKVSLKSGSSRSIFGGCSELNELEVSKWEVPMLSTGWLMHCPRLTTMKLQSLSVPMIKRIITGVRSLLSLKIQDSTQLRCAAKVTSDCYQLFAGLENLQHLDLSGNGIRDIDRNFFNGLTSLKNLDLSSNEISSSWDVLPSMTRLDNLQSLTLAQNRFAEWCSFFYAIKPIFTFPNEMKTLNLKNTGIEDTCARSIASNTHVEFLDMTSNGVETLKFGSLPFGNDRFTIDLRHNSIREIVLTRDDFEELSEIETPVLRVVLDEIHIKCDCEHQWLALALRQFPSMKVEGLSCEKGVPLDMIELDELKCVKFICSGCLCRHWETGQTRVNCSGVSLVDIPRVQNLTDLDVRGTGLQKLQEEDFPSSLVKVDLSGNKLSHVDTAVADRIFSDPNRIVRLVGNPIACDCKNNDFITKIQENFMQIEDYNDVRCADDMPIAEVVAGNLCELEARQTQLTAALAASGALAFLAFLTLVVTLQYRHKIRVFIHARGWCPCFFYEADDDRPYDVFLSFSHGDEELVVGQILPKLENGPHEYSVCIHYRDWIAGEWIPMQIARSVQLSRRTLIIVSSSFLESMWGLLEFRTAMMCSAREGRYRVVLVLMDEELIHDARIDPELRTYLTANTYLCWDDPWFWDKLYYALPHCQRRRKKEDSNPMSSELIPTSVLDFNELQSLIP